MAIIFRMFLDENNAVGVNKIARKMLYDFKFFPCYECRDGESKQGQILEYVSTNNDEHIRFFVFLKHCMRQYDGLGFEQWEIEKEYEGRKV